MSSPITAHQFQTYFHDNFEPLCQLAFQVVGDADVAKDLVQEFFIYIWDKRGQIQLRGSFEGYAYRAVKNIANTYLKRKKYLITYIGDQYPVDIAGVDLDLETEAEKEKIYKKLRECIAGLPESRREVFLMSNVMGMTYAEIAIAKNVSVNTVKTQIKQAYATLRRQLPDHLWLYLFLSNYWVYLYII